MSAFFSLKQCLDMESRLHLSSFIKDKSCWTYGHNKSYLSPCKEAIYRNCEIWSLFFLGLPIPFLRSDVVLSDL